MQSSTDDSPRLCCHDLSFLTLRRRYCQFRYCTFSFLYWLQTSERKARSICVVAVVELLKISSSLPILQSLPCADFYQKKYFDFGSQQKQSYLFWPSTLIMYCYSCCSFSLPVAYNLLSVVGEVHILSRESCEVAFKVKVIVSHFSCSKRFFC